MIANNPGLASASVSMNTPSTLSAASSRSSTISVLEKPQEHVQQSETMLASDLEDNARDATETPMARTEKRAEETTEEKAEERIEESVDEKTEGKTSGVASGNTMSRVASGMASIRLTETREDGSEYPTGLKLFLITVALCLAVFLMCLDNTIIATAIPKITDEFNSLDDLGWYASSYLLTTASLQLLFGKLYSYLNIKWVFLTAIAIFELGSLVCGVAPNSTALIVGRAIAGAGAAGLMSGALIILAFTVPLQKRPMYTGGIAAMYGIASVAGPLLGGVFTDKVTWRWCFYINLPIGAVTVLVIILFFQVPAGATTASSDGKTRREILMEFDPVGTIVLMPAVICLLLALQWGGTTYAWDNGRIIALFVLFGVLLAVFIYIQHRQQDNATVPPRVLRNRTVWAGAFFAFTVGASFFLAIYFLPLWFQAVKGASAVRSGIMNLPMLISVVVFSLISGALVTVLGYYTPFMIVSTVIMSIGYGLIYTFRPDTASSVWIGYQVLAGTGIGLGLQQPLMAVQTVLSAKDMPTGTAVIVFMQTIGGSLFVSVAQNVFNNKLVQYVHEDAPGLDPSIVIGAGATALQTTIRNEYPQYLEGATLAYNDALMQTFLVSAAIAATSIIGSGLMEWKSVKGKKIEMGVA